jgi:hypothetical protein
MKTVAVLLVNRVWGWAVGTTWWRGDRGDAISEKRQAPEGHCHTWWNMLNAPQLQPRGSVGIRCNTRRRT